MEIQTLHLVTFPSAASDDPAPTSFEDLLMLWVWTRWTWKIQMLVWAFQLVFHSVTQQQACPRQEARFCALMLCLVPCALCAVPRELLFVLLAGTALHALDSWK